MELNLSGEEELLEDCLRLLDQLVNEVRSAQFGDRVALLDHVQDHEENAGCLDRIQVREQV